MPLNHSQNITLGHQYFSVHITEDFLKCDTSFHEYKFKNYEKFCVYAENIFFIKSSH